MCCQVGGYSFMLSLSLSAVVALQARPVHCQRARRRAGGGRLGSLEPLRYLLTDVRRGHQDRRARVQPTRVSRPLPLSLSLSICHSLTPSPMVSVE